MVHGKGQELIAPPQSAYLLVLAALGKTGNSVNKKTNNFAPFMVRGREREPFAP
jgi:hypothetical protein